MTLSIRPMTVERVPALMADLCPADRAELAAAGIRDPLAMLCEAVSADASVEELHDGDTCIAVFGVTRLHGGGIPWMLTTTAMERACRHEVARLSLQVIERMRAEFDYLTNWAHVRNARALRFIRWLGFKINDEPVGPGGEFRVFHWSL